MGRPLYIKKRGNVLKEGELFLKKYAGLMFILVFISLVGCSSSSGSADDQIPTSGKIIVHQDKYQDEYEMRTGKYESNGETVNIRSMEDNSVQELSKTFNTLGIEISGRFLSLQQIPCPPKDWG